MRPHRGPYIDGDLELADEAPLQAAGSSTAQHFHQYRGDDVIGVAQRGTLVADGELLRRRGLGDLDAALLELDRLGLDVLHGELGRQQMTVTSAYFLEQTRLREVPDGDHGGVVGGVVRRVELRAVL